MSAQDPDKPAPPVVAPNPRLADDPTATPPRPDPDADRDGRSFLDVLMRALSAVCF